MYSYDSLHEASHVVLGAYVGGANIQVILDRGKPRCTFGHHLAIPGLVMSYAGYAGDRLISRLLEADCVARSQSDRERRQWILEKLANPPGEASISAEAERTAFELVGRFRDEIFRVAALIERHMQQRRSLPADEIEQLECVAKVRALGREEGQVEARQETK